MHPLAVVEVAPVPCQPSASQRRWRVEGGVTDALVEGCHGWTVNGRAEDRLKRSAMVMDLQPIISWACGVGARKAMTPLRDYGSCWSNFAIIESGYEAKGRRHGCEKR